MQFKSYNYYLRLVKENTTLNSEKETKLEEYNNIVNYYNANKDKFKSIFSRQQETWEDEAKKIINGNEYLFMKWQLDKLEQTQLTSDEKLRTGKLTSDEKNNIRIEIQENKKKIDQLKREIDEKIRLDLNKINQL